MKDTVVGKYNTSRPVLQLFCLSNDKTLRLQIHTDQLIMGQTNVAMGARVGWTSVMIQRDDQPEQQVAWLFSMDSHVIGPEEEDRKSVDEAVASSRYRVGMMLNPVGRRYVEFDLTGIAERAEQVATYCRNTPKHYSK